MVAGALIIIAAGLGIGCILAAIAGISIWRDQHKAVRP